jgi:hypothetical protein
MSNLSSIAIVFNGLYVGGAEKFGISIANKFVDNGFNTSIILFKETNCSLFDQIDKRIEIIFIPGNLNMILYFTINLIMRSTNEILKK